LRRQQRQEDACGGEAQHHHETVLVRIAVPAIDATQNSSPRVDFSM
jgi:hypothetical protein